MWLNPYRYVVESIQKGVASKMWNSLPPLIKSPAEDLPQDTQREESSTKGRIRLGTCHRRSWCVRVFWHQLGTTKERGYPRFRKVK
jgi:hypothetical protein